MLQDKSSNDIFSWDSSGTSFIVKDTNEFSKKILPQHFKHCNFASFVRQLNKYDFHKIRNSDDGQKLNGDQVIFYYATPLFLLTLFP
jgi:osomolarity two-component system response regulator SKN7